jgi:hypothetical protein
VIDYWMSQSPYTLGLVPLKSLNSTTLDHLYDFASPLPSLPTYTHLPNRPDRNAHHDMLALYFAHFLNDGKKFVKSLTSFYARVNAMTPRQQPLNRHSDGKSRSNVKPDKDRAERLQRQSEEVDTDGKKIEEKEFERFAGGDSSDFITADEIDNSMEQQSSFDKSLEERDTGKNEDPKKNVSENAGGLGAGEEGCGGYPNFLNETFRAVDPLWLDVPTTKLHGQGMPQYPLRISRLHYNLTFHLDSQEGGTSRGSNGEGLKTLLTALDDMTADCRLSFVSLPIAGGLYLYENGFVGAKEPVDSTTRYLQALLLTHASAFKKLKPIAEACHNSRNDALFQSLSPDIKNGFAEGQENQTDCCDNVFSIPFHPYVHALPLRTPHPRYPQLDVLHAAMPAEPGSSAHQPSRARPDDINDRILAEGPPSPLVPPVLLMTRTFYFIDTTLNLLRRIGLAPPPTTRELYTFYHERPASNGSSTKREDAIKTEREEEMTWHPVLAYGLLRPAYYPMCLIVPGLLAPPHQ